LKITIIFLDKLGWVDDRVLAGREVLILGDQRIIPGVIGVKSRHLVTREELALPLDVRKMWIETGLTRDELERSGVRAGTGVSFATRFRKMANGYVCGKALDCRIGCAVLIEVLFRLVEMSSPVLAGANIAAAFTVQEEIGAKGAAVVAYDLKPSFAIVLDTVPCEDPVVSLENQSVRLGAGPVIRTFDYHSETMYGCWTHPTLLKEILCVAQEAAIPHQLDIMTSTFLDSSTLHLTGSGVPTAAVCFPRRYSHSPVEVSHEEDIEYSVQLLVRFLNGRFGNLEFERRLK